MGVTDHTVKALTRTVYEQLGAVNNAHAVALAIGLELIPATVATHPTQGAPDVP